MPCHFSILFVFFVCCACFVNSGWKALERISTQSISKHHIASQSSFFNGPDCHSAGRDDFRVRARRATKDCRSGPSVFRRGFFFYDVFIFLMISSMVFHCFSLFSIVFQKKSTNHRPTVGSGLIRIGNRQRVWQLPILDHSDDIWWRTVRYGKVC